MNEQEVDAVAQRLCVLLKENRKDFFVEPEQHYNDHRDIASLIADYKAAKNIFWKAFIGLAVLGGLVLALIGVSAHR
jgi:hypothetical protein